MFIFFWKTCPQIRSSVAYSSQPVSHYIFVLISYNLKIFVILSMFGGLWIFSILKQNYKTATFITGNEVDDLPLTLFIRLLDCREENTRIKGR